MTAAGAVRGGWAWLAVAGLACWLAPAALATEIAAVAPASQAASQAASAPLPAATYFRPAEIGAARLSPSGRWLALTALALNGRHGLAVMDLNGAGAITMAAHYSDMDVANFQWVNDDRLVFNLSDQEAAAGERRYAPGLFSVRRDGTEIRQLVQMRHQSRTSPTRHGDRALDLSHGLLHVPAGGGDEIIVGEYRRDHFGDPEALLPKRLNVVTGRVSSLARGMPDYATRWLFDAQGEPRVASATRDGRLRIHWRADVQIEGAQGWAEIANFDAALASWDPHSLDAAGRLYVTVPEGAAGERVLKRFNFATGQPEREALVVVPGFDFTGSVVAETTGGAMLAVRADTDAETTIWSDPRMKAVQEEVDRRLPGRINSLSCRRCKEADVTVLVHSWSDRDPGRYWVWRGEPAAPTLWRPIGAHRKGIDPQRMASLDFQRYRARDGREIPVWITTPAGHVPGHKLPAVVLPHGGPWVRGGHWRWEPMAQFLASRGYLVIEPEFRGSTGYGAEHYRAGWKQWGQAMQDDLADAVAWAAGRNLVDASRVCIAGGSYGGYAALMGLVRHPEIYRCGAAWVAVTDLALRFKSSWDNDSTEEGRKFVLPILMGDPDTDAEMLRAVSPLQQAGRIKAPVLLAFGEADRRVPLEHGSKMRAALQAAGNEPEYVVYEGEGHTWQRTSSRVDFAQRLERFLALHLK